jgi:putative ABC transport system substrate-binding protein
VERQVLGGDINWSGWMDQMITRHGFIEGKTIIYERYLVPNETAPEIVPKILASKPDAIFWGGPLLAPKIAAGLDKTTPMVTHQNDILELGIVTNFGRPGGNITGVSANASPDSQAKLFALLAEAVPKAKRFAYLVPGRDGKVFPGYQRRLDVVNAAAAKLGVSVMPVFIEEVGLTEAQIAQAFATIKANGIEAAQIGVGVTVLTAPVPQIIADMAIAAKLPMIAGPYVFADAGGLMSYGVDVPYQCRQAADYCAMILKGAKPGTCRSCSRLFMISSSTKRPQTPSALPSRSRYSRRQAG